MNGLKMFYSEPSGVTHMDVSALALGGFLVIIAIAVIIDGIRTLRSSRVGDCRKFLAEHPEFCRKVCDVCKEEAPTAGDVGA